MYAHLRPTWRRFLGTLQVILLYFNRMVTLTRLVETWNSWKTLQFWNYLTTAIPTSIRSHYRTLNDNRLSNMKGGFPLWDMGSIR